MKFVNVLFAMLVMTALNSVADTTDIYQPKVLVAGVAEEEAVERQYGSWGFGIAQVGHENLPASLVFNFSGRYFAGERWYVLAGLQLTEFNDRLLADDQGRVLAKKGVNAVVLNSGIGYYLMQGTATVTGDRAYPWQLGVEGYLGEQFTGETSGHYLGSGISWQMLFDSRWIALEWRMFQVNDDNLIKAEVDKGTQWGLSFGSYF